MRACYSRGFKIDSTGNSNRMTQSLTFHTLGFKANP